VGLAFVFIVTLSVAQQPKTGQIRGHVIDVGGAVIVGASVYVRANSSSEENIRLLTRSDRHGDFKLELPEGGYDVLITSRGFASGFKTLPVFAGKDRKAQWKLEPLGCNFPLVNCDPVTVH
jgi:hypothetical protein